MAKLPQKRKRRGVILSPWGWQRLQTAQEHVAIAENQGYVYTLEQLSDLTQLSVRSISRMQSCKVAVDRQTLEEFFRAFGLTLTEQDYFQPDSVEQPVYAIAQDWGDAPDVSLFYGRTTEISSLTQWILDDRCRLIGIIGIGGIGKTALSVKLAEQVQPNFTYVIWRSLRNATSLETLLSDLVPLLSEQQDLKPELSSLLQCLRNSRCLVILDNMETLLETGNRSGQYRAGYEGYGELLRVVAETRHQSCFVVTSREKCAQFAQLEGGDAVQGLTLNGSPEAAAALLSTMGFSDMASSEMAYMPTMQTTGKSCTQMLCQSPIKTLCERYQCNPLALKIVATTIRDLFAGNISLFLEQNVTLFGDISDLIHKQYSRLSSLEKQIMLWLAIGREWISFAQLLADFNGSVSPIQLMEALQLLQRRSLIETNAGQFTLQPVVMEYTTENLIDRVCQDIANQVPAGSVLQTHALLKAQDKDYIRDSQTRVIMTPLVARLLSQFGSQKELVYQLRQILAHLQTYAPNQAGYAGGNILNLLCYLQVDLSDYDLSYLSIWQADLQNVPLHRVNFSHSDLSKSRFSQPFGSILSVVFSPDGQLLATGDTNSEVCLWQVADGQPKTVFSGHRSWVWAIAWLLEGELLASGGEDYSVRLWNTETGECRGILQGHQGTVRTLAAQPYGHLLASGGDDHEIRLWDIDTKACVAIYQGHSNWVMSVAWSPDGQILASASLDQTIRLWDAKSGQCLASLSGHDQGIWAIAWSPNGQLLATGGDEQCVKLWDVKSGQCLKTLQRNHSGIFSIAWSPDSKLLASSGEDRNITIWDTVSDRCLKTLQGHSNTIWSVAWSKDGSVLASGSHDQTVRLWEMYSQTSNDCRCLKTLQGCSNYVFAVAWSADGATLASSSADYQIRLWNPDAGLCLKALPGHRKWIWGLAWNRGTFAGENSRDADAPSFCVAAASDRMLLASASDDCTVRLWSPHTGECLKILRGHQSWVWAVAWHPNSQVLASAGGDLTIRLWDVQRDQCLHILEGHRNWIWGLAWSPDGNTLASASDDCTVRLWNPTTGDCIQVLQGHDYWVEAVAWSPDSSMIASGSHDQTVRVWDVKTGKCLHVLEGHTNMIRAVAWSADGQMLASGSHDQTVRLWQPHTGECLHTLEGHRCQIWSVAWRPGGDVGSTATPVLASGSADETIKLWDCNTGQCFKTLRADRPYEGMNIGQATGMTEAQKATLTALGAIATNVKP